LSASRNFVVRLSLSLSFSCRLSSIKRSIERLDLLFIFTDDEVETVVPLIAAVALLGRGVVPLIAAVVLLARGVVPLIAAVVLLGMGVVPLIAAVVLLGMGVVPLIAAVV